jgi:ParB family transcriptional regulator, chromosome partitioning protein
MDTTTTQVTTTTGVDLDALAEKLVNGGTGQDEPGNEPPKGEQTDNEVETTERKHVEVAPIHTDDIASRSELRSMTTRANETVKIAFDKIKPRPGFNVRENYGDIEGLAKSILMNGLIMPLHVDVMSDGTAYLTDGYRRHRALTLLKEQGNGIKDVECFVQKQTTTEEDRLKKMFITQDNKKLEPMEVANIFLRLQNLGYSVENISEQFGWSVTNVRNYLGLATETTEIKNMVREGKVKATTAFELKKKVKDPIERGQILKELQSTGKVKTKDIKSLDPNSPTSVAKAVETLSSKLIGFTPEIQAILRVAIKYVKSEASEEEMDGLNKIKFAANEDESTEHPYETKLAKMEEVSSWFNSMGQARIALILGYFKGTVDEDRLVELDG